jgi:hypothetical protein
MVKRLICRSAALVALALAAPAPAGAIVNGAPDGTAHPYAGIANAEHGFCSGFLISPTVMLTAGHCTAAFADDGGVADVSFDEHPDGDSAYITATPHTMPGFADAPPQGLGLPASVTHDLGVLVLDDAVDLPRYAELPAPWALDGLAPGAPLTYVGYGADGWHTGGGRPYPEFSFDRLAGRGSFLGVNTAVGDEFASVSAVRGRTGAGGGPGDSGSPVLLAGTDVAVALGSHVTSLTGDGRSYAARLDTEEALAFILPFVD